MRIAYFLLLISIQFVCGKDILITELGAFGDGKKLNTIAIQKAIDSCYRSGGGKVIVPPGEFLTGTIQLRSNVEFHVSAGATLLGSKNLNDYPDFPSNVMNRATTYGESKSLIVAIAQENVSLTGKGTIFFNGMSPEFKKIIKDTTAGEFFEGKNRPFGMRFIKCKNLKVEDITLKESAYWMQHYIECSFVRIRGIRVFNHCNYNSDGIDLDGCDNVTMSDCIIDSGDDGLCLKSESLRMCEDIVISNCILSSHCNGFKLGTGSMGGFRNITLSNCIIKPPVVNNDIVGIGKEGVSGISLECVDGGTLENISINNIVMDSCGTPFFIRLGNMARKPHPSFPIPKIGIARNINISNVIVKNTNKLSSSITDIPNAFVENISFSNIQIENKEGSDKIVMDVPENEKGYPEAYMFKTDLPSSAFYVRHAKGISFNNIAFTAIKSEIRPVLVCDDVENLQVKDFRIENLQTPKPKYLIQLKDVKTATISEFNYKAPLETLLKISNSTGIILSNNFLPGCSLLTTEKDFDEIKMKSFQNILKTK